MKEITIKLFASFVNAAIIGLSVWYHVKIGLTNLEWFLITIVMLGISFIGGILAGVSIQKELSTAVLQAKEDIAREALTILAKGKVCLDQGCPFCDAEEAYQYAKENNLDWDDGEPTHPPSATAKVAKRALADMDFYNFLK